MRKVRPIKQLHALLGADSEVYVLPAVGGMPGMNGRGAGPRQDAPIEHALPCSLEELYKGTSKRMKISRNVTDASGRSERVSETLTVDVKPGWKKGTRVTFPKKGESLLRAAQWASSHMLYFALRSPRWCRLLSVGCTNANPGGACRDSVIVYSAKQSCVMLKCIEATAPLLFPLLKHLQDMIYDDNR